MEQRMKINNNTQRTEKEKSEEIMIRNVKTQAK